MIDKIPNLHLRRLSLIVALLFSPLIAIGYGLLSIVDFYCMICVDAKNAWKAKE